jgi:hypothetical protein
MIGREQNIRSICMQHRWRAFGAGPVSESASRQVMKDCLTQNIIRILGFHVSIATLFFAQYACTLQRLYSVYTLMLIRTSSAVFSKPASSPVVHHSQSPHPSSCSAFCPAGACAPGSLPCPIANPVSSRRLSSCRCTRHLYRRACSSAGDGTLLDPPHCFL